MKLTYKATTSVEKTIKITKPKYRLHTEYCIERNYFPAILTFDCAEWDKDKHEWLYFSNKLSRYESEIKLINIK